jgi:hypothetical protein
MSTKALKWYIDVPPKLFLSAKERLVFVFLCLKHDEKEQKPLKWSRKIIKEEARISDDRTYYACITHLKELGLISVEESNNTAHTFTLNFGACVPDRVCKNTDVNLQTCKITDPVRDCKITEGSSVKLQTLGTVKLQTTKTNIYKTINEGADNAAPSVSRTQNQNAENAKTALHVQDESAAICNALGAEPVSDSNTVAKPQTKTKTARAKAANGVAKPESVDAQIWGDYLIVRKAKGAPLTLTALRNIENQAKLAGITLNEALKFCVNNDWRGFRAEWYKKRMQEEKAAEEAQKPKKMVPVRW